MLRPRLNDELKAAMKAKDVRAVSTLRLILAALKDRDIAARGKGNTEGIGEDEIGELLQKMVRQRHEAIALYEQGNRKDLAQQERDEIAVIERFLPRQLDETEVEAAVGAAIAAVGAMRWTRCTTLVKFPVALSGGSSAYFAPVPIDSPMFLAIGWLTDALYCTQSNFQMFHTGG